MKENDKPKEEGNGVWATKIKPLEDDELSMKTKDLEKT